MGLRIGVIGTGRLGKQHVRILKRIPEVDFVGCHDVVQERSLGVAEEFGAQAFPNAQALLEAVDSVSVVVPTVNHRDVSVPALEMGKHVFLEKPIAGSVEEARRIIDAAKKAERVLQVGHVERFNEAIRTCRPYIESPSFIEIHRLAPFTVRGIDVSVIMDLMIHDIDLLTFFLGKQPVDIRAKGAGILTDAPDIVNARFEYDCGCVANLTASRVSLEPMRKVRVFSRNGYLSIDLFEGKIKHFRKGDSYERGIEMLKRQKSGLEDISLHDFLQIDETSVQGEEPLYNELRSFCRAVLNGTEPEVAGEDGLEALMLAVEIQRLVENDLAR